MAIIKCPTSPEVVFKILKGVKSICMSKMTEMEDLWCAEKDMRTKEKILDIAPDFHMYCLSECFCHVP